MKLIALSFLGLLFACKNHTASPSTGIHYDADSMVLNKYNAATIVDRTGLDGCLFLVLLADSTTLEVVNLPDSVKKDQLKIWIKYTTAAGQMSTCMAGKMVKMLDLKLRDK